MELKPPASRRKSQREIFAAALDCSDPAERRRILDTECGGDTELREAVESLLEESSEIGDFLERPAVIDTRMTLFDPAREGADSLGGEMLGDQVGPYTLRDHIGEGGGGSVYLAEQTTPVQRRVALKILKLGMDTRSVIARFEAERQTLAMMEHPNIARVIDAGATEEGRPYFVMEYVPGEPVTTYCDKHSLTIEQRLAILIKICRAVEHAHQKGIIHRDLKPSNILVGEQDGEAIPKIIDFGVAKAIDPLTGGTSVLTVIETIIGTPAYMSPEQAERGNRDIDTRSDVYSLGVILYELLTGYTPLGAKGAGKSGVSEILKTLSELKPVRPSASLQDCPRKNHESVGSQRGTTVERLITRVRGDLDWIVMKCLERERSRRFGSASDLARDLELYLEGAPVTARPPSVAYRLGKFVRRHRVVVGSCALLVLTLLGAAAVSVAYGIRATRAEEVQSELRAEAERDRERALRSAAEARHHQYVAHINLAHHALLEGHMAKALLLLDHWSSVPPGEADMRGFEWWYLMGKCLGDEHLSLPRQDAPIESLAFGPDGKQLGIATRERLLLWSLDENRVVRSFPEGAWSVVFFPAGDRLVAAGRQGVVVYEVDSGDIAWQLRERDSAIAVSPDGGLLATSDRRGVTLWNTVTWAQDRHLPRASGPLSFASDGKTLATGGRDGITLWDLESDATPVVLEESPRSGPRPRPGEQGVLFSRDGRFVVLAQNGKPTETGYSMGIWDAKSGKELSMLPETAGNHTGVISAASFDRAGALLATSSWDHSVRLWDFESRKLRRSLYGHRGEVWSVALAPTGDFVASGSKDGEVKIWPAERRARKDSIEGSWKHLGFSAEGNELAAYDRDGVLSLFQVRSGEVVRSMDLSAADARSRRRPAVSLSRDFSVLAEGLPDGTVRIRNLEKKTESSFQAADRPLELVALSPAADTLVAIGWRDELAWWDLARTDQPIARVEASHAMYSADGTTLVAFSREGEVVVWDTATRQERIRLGGDESSRGSRLALSPDGGLLAMTHGFEDYDNTISLWSTTTGERLGTFAGHKQGIWSIAFSPDGKTLASSSSGGIVRLWNVASRSELLTIRDLGTILTDLQFSPDGRCLVSSSPSFSTRPELRLFRASTAESD